MTWILGWAPFVINLFLIPKFDVIGILFISISLLIGLILIYLYDFITVCNYYSKGKGNSEKCKKAEEDMDIAKAGIIGGIYSGLKNTKDCIEDISDVDHWKKI